MSRSSVNVKTRLPKAPELGTPGVASSILRRSMAVWIVVDRSDACDAGSPRSARKYSRPISSISWASGATIEMFDVANPVRSEKNPTGSDRVAESPTTCGGAETSERHRRSRFATWAPCVPA
jgi:hypothetical protein